MMELPKLSFFLWGVKLGWGAKIKQQTEKKPCYTFLKLDRKTYYIEFGF